VPNLGFLLHEKKALTLSDMNFFKTFLATLLALTVFTFLSFLFFILLLAGMSAQKTVVVRSNSVLHLKLDAQITEQEVDNPFEELPWSSQPPGIGLVQLRETLKHAAEDPNIQGIFLQVTYPMAGFATLEEIRSALLRFRQSGKWVVAYSDVMSEPAYYVATASDKIYLNPEGELEFNGLTVEVSFFKRLFDKLEIKPEIFRVGDYKSAVEPFMLEKMSAENRQQITELVESVYGFILSRIAEERNIPEEHLRKISDKMLVRNAAQAVAYRLVDSLLYYDEVIDEMKSRIGLEEKKDLNLITYKKYRKSVVKPVAKESENEIAVVVAEGTIIPGKSQEGVIGSDSFSDVMRKVRKNKKVKAVVLRINSPGGSFQASDAMWREIVLTSREKPVIASMSDYAASGGYYMAMACDSIVAQPHTITGSIGIFSVLFDASDFLRNKLGITFDEVRTGEFGEMITLTRPLSDAEKQFWQKRTEEIYETFTRKAAEGRRVSQQTIKQVAGGRVWTGDQALDRKLVDVLGGLDDAVQLAAQAAGIGDDFRIRYYPRRRPFIEQVLSSLEGTAESRFRQLQWGYLYPFYQQWNTIRDYLGAQARMPFELYFR
jgi:protease-4